MAGSLLNVLCLTLFILKTNSCPIVEDTEVHCQGSRGQRYNLKFLSLYHIYKGNGMMIDR